MNENMCYQYSNKRFIRIENVINVQFYLNLN
jgi:hypothetical protein